MNNQPKNKRYQKFKTLDSNIMMNNNRHTHNITNHLFNRQNDHDHDSISF